MQVTTALRKISSLRKRNWVIQGGQGAGKTIAILMILANHASSNPDREIYIASQELTKMRQTVIKDFIKVLKGLGLYDDRRFIGGTFYRFPNGSFIKFLGLDKEDIGKGLRSDVVFVNEANKVPFDTYRELTSRAKRVIVDFNPNNEFWVHTEVLNRPDTDHLILTFLDNEFLSKEERNEILLNKERAYHDPNLENYDVEHNVKSKYWQNKWHIYGLGKTGSNPNRIFTWDEIADIDYHKIPAKKYYASDWGVVDPWGVLEAKYHDGCLYLHELNYASENLIMAGLTPTERLQVQSREEGLISWIFERIGVDKRAEIACDNNRPLKVIALREAGYDYAFTTVKFQGSIIDGIDLLQKLRVYYTASSKNIKFEQENYARKVDRYGINLDEPEDVNNHLIDPARYIALYLRQEGIIKVI